MPNPTGPLGEPQVFQDPEAHRKLDELTQAVKTILAWIQGDQMAGIPGMAAEHRKHAERLDTIEERVERHAKRLHALETASTERVKWGLRTFTEQALKVAASAVVGAITALVAVFAAKPPHP